MAAPTTERPSWNPLSCSGTALAPNVLLAAKLIVLCLLFTWNWLYGWPGVFVSQFQWDWIRWPSLFWEPFLAWVFVGAALALLLNRAARFAALIVGLATPWGTPFATLFLLLTTFSDRAPWLLRYLIALFYLLVLPAAYFNGGFGWETPLAFSLLGAGFLVRRAWPYVIWLGLLFHASGLWLHNEFGPLFHLLLPISYLVFAPWPKEQLTILYDGDCGFCETTRRFFERFDFDHIYDWQPFQSGAGDHWGIPTAALERAAHVVANGKVYAGFRAFQALTLYTPLTYFVLAALLLVAGITLPEPTSGVIVTFAPFRPFVAAQPVIAALALALYFPLFRPLGEAAYQLIARNRHRLPGEKTCKVA